MNDIVFVEQLRATAILGILPHERITPQTVIIDLAVETDISVAATSHNIEDALNYADLAERVKSLTIDGEYLLIETLINDIANVCLDSPLAVGVTVEVRKPEAIADAVVGLRIHRAK